MHVMCSLLQFFFRRVFAAHEQTTVHVRKMFARPPWTPVAVEDSTVPRQKSTILSRFEKKKQYISDLKQVYLSQHSQLSFQRLY